LGGHQRWLIIVIRVKQFIWEPYKLKNIELPRYQMLGSEKASGVRLRGLLLLPQGTGTSRNLSNSFCLAAETGCNFDQLTTKVCRSLKFKGFVCLLQ